MLPFLQRSRMNSMFGSPQARSRTNYPIFDEFLSSIAPLMDNQDSTRETPELKFKRQQFDKQNEFTPAIPNPAFQLEMPEPPEQKQPNVSLGINPYQSATLDLRERELSSREALNKAKLEEAEKKNTLAAEDRSKRTALLEEKESKNNLTEEEKIELKFLKDMERQRQSQRFTETRQEDAQRFTESRDDKRANLERELVNLRNDNTKAAVERKAVIDRELAAFRQDIKPDSATQEKTAMQVKYNKLINQKPEYRDWITNENGVITVAPVGEVKNWAPDVKGPTKEQREEILKALGMNEEKKEEDPNAPPEGMKPGGKWITTPRGIRIYQEP